MAGAFARQPLAALVAVFLLPGLWAVPATIAEESLVPAEETTFELGRVGVSSDSDSESDKL